MYGSDLISSAPPPPHHPPPPPPSAADDEEGTLLAPGFRFHPTDDELVTYYLKRKIQNKPLRVDAIGEIDLYKCEPWDLPSKSKIRSRDLEWYFFSPLDRKQSNNRLRTNRGTEQGYWKTTGKDREVRHGGRVAGMKKTLVYHIGRAPRGKRTNWVMHEYRLEGDGVTEESYVVCRIFQKNGPGPQNGAQYGAPFVEEEWDALTDNIINNNNKNGLFMIGASENNHNDDDSNEYLQMEDLLQNQELDNTLITLPPAVDTSSPVLTGEDLTHSNITLLDASSSIPTGEDAAKIDEYLELNDLASDLLALNNNNNDYNNNNDDDDETLNFEEFFDPKDSFMNMSSEIIYSPQNSGIDYVDEFLTYYDAPEDDNLFYDDFSYYDNKVVDENSVFTSNVSQDGSSSTKLQEDDNNNNLSGKKPHGKFATFLDSYSAPPAFAEEFPFSTSAKSLSPDMFQIDNMALTAGTGNADMALLLSYSNPKYHCGISSVLRGGFCMFFVSAVMLMVSYKIGICVCEH